VRLSDEGLEKRIHYRREFAKRNKKYEGLKKEIAELENIRKRQNNVENVVADKRYFGLLAELLVWDSQTCAISAIKVKHKYGWYGLNYEELTIDVGGDEHFKIHSVDKQEKTVIVKVHLDRKKEDIIKDVKFLLDLLYKEAKSYKVDLKAKKPQWDVYDKYIQVYDLKKADPNMEWSDIAKKVIPEEVNKHEAPHRKTRKTELPSKTAIDKVRYYWREADRMIDKKGWMKI
jgi:hypothetical protein